MSADSYLNSAGLEEPLSWNRASHVGGDAINRFDPSGKEWWDPKSNTLYGDPPLDIMTLLFFPMQGNLSLFQPPRSANYQLTMQKQLETTLPKLGTHCKQVLPTMTTLQQDAKDMRFINAGSGSATFNSPLSSVVPKLAPFNPGTINSLITGHNAIILWAGPQVTGHSTPISSTVLLGDGFYNHSTSDEGFTLVHELLHYATQLGDDEFYSTYNIKGVYGDSTSSAITAWLKNDCFNPKKRLGGVKSMIGSVRSSCFLAVGLTMTAMAAVADTPFEISYSRQSGSRATESVILHGSPFTLASVREVCATLCPTLSRTHSIWTLYIFGDRMSMDKFGLMPPPDSGFSNWLRLYRDISGKHVEVAEVIGLGNNEVLRVRTKDGLVSETVIAGGDFTTFVQKGISYQILEVHLDFYKPPPHIRLPRLPTRVKFFVRCPLEINFSDARSAAAYIKRMSGQSEVQVKFRKDPFWYEDYGFPVFYPFEAERLSPPSVLEDLGPSISCLVGEERGTCDLMAH